MDIFLRKLSEVKAKWEILGSDLIRFYKGKDKLVSTDIKTSSYPGFMTDWQAPWALLMTQVKGVSIIHETIFEDRFGYVRELRKMGADIEIVDPHRAFVFGPKNLYGTTVSSSDVRAGACLIVAGLIAEGTTTVENVYQIDRGYEKIEERLQKLGADIKRVSA